MWLPAQTNYNKPGWLADPENLENPENPENGVSDPENLENTENRQK